MTNTVHDQTEEKEPDLTLGQRDAYLRQGSDFEPDKDLKETWLPLRKTSPRKWGGIEYPGLFDYRGDRDTRKFYWTLFLEVTSATFIIWLMFVSGKVGAGLAFAAIFINLLLDGVFAYLHHLSQREVCIKKNRDLRFFSEGWKNGIDSYSKHALSIEQDFKGNPKVWFWRPVATVLIWAYALIKIGFFLALFLQSDLYYEMVEEQSAGLLATAVAIIAVGAYVWIAVNHTFSTGYYLAYHLSHQRQSKNAFSTYIRAVGAGSALGNKKSEEIKRRYSAASRNKEINLSDFCRLVLQVDVPEFRHFQQDGRSTELVKRCLESGLIEKRIDKWHSLVQIPEQKNTWKLTCYGLLTDEQLDELVKVQPTDLAQLAVAYYGHTIQMESVNL